MLNIIVFLIFNIQIKFERKQKNDFNLKKQKTDNLYYDRTNQ